MSKKYTILVGQCVNKLSNLYFLYFIVYTVEWSDLGLCAENVDSWSSTINTQTSMTVNKHHKEKNSNLNQVSIQQNNNPILNSSCNACWAYKPLTYKQRCSTWNNS